MGRPSTGSPERPARTRQPAPAARDQQRAARAVTMLSTPSSPTPTSEVSTAAEFGKGNEARNQWSATNRKSAPAASPQLAARCQLSPCQRYTGGLASKSADWRWLWRCSKLLDGLGPLSSFGLAEREQMELLIWWIKLIRQEYGRCGCAMRMRSWKLYLGRLQDVMLNRWLKGSHWMESCVWTDGHWKGSKGFVSRQDNFCGFLAT